MVFDVKESGIVFVLDGQQYTRADLKKLLDIVTDLAQTNDYEWPYLGPELQSRAATIVGKSKK